MVVKLTRQSLDWALSHVEKLGDTDIFPVPFEYLAIRQNWDSLATYLSSQDLDTWQVRPFRKCMTPKHRYGFRIATQLDPLDLLIYTALVYEIGTELEEHRIPAGDEVVFSFRFKPTDEGYIYDPTIHWSSFLRRSRELADSASYSHVVLADIADFYPRLYLHRLENALDGATTKPGHARALIKIIKQWNNGVSYGIPVGPTVSRLLAEITIDDIDRGLLAERAVYCRYSDDFRIFCETKREAYERLETLARFLLENHGLTLQQYKTSIVPIEEFHRRYLATEVEVERDTSMQAKINALNLHELLREQLSVEDIDMGMFKFILQRLSQLGDSEMVDEIISSIDNCYPVIPQIIKYVQTLRGLDPNQKVKLGHDVITLLTESVVGHLQFHRCWILNIFTFSNEWNNRNEFPRLYSLYTDQFSARKLVLALGRAKHDYWFRQKKHDLMSFPPWIKRAFLAAASCMQADERKFWYGSIKNRLDQLEQAVVEWAKAYPF